MKKIVGSGGFWWRDGDKPFEYEHVENWEEFVKRHFRLKVEYKLWLIKIPMKKKNW